MEEERDMDDHFLALMPLYDGTRDIGGVECPPKGMMRCDGYKDDDSILTGLFGFKWGDSSEGSHLPDGQYAVVRVSGPVVELDHVGNTVKFRDCYVVCRGDRDRCMEVIGRYRGSMEGSPRDGGRNHNGQ